MMSNESLPAAVAIPQHCNTVMVCGHGRCGSSLVMQMLQAGGFPVFGEYPAFEPEEVGFDRNSDILLSLISGRAAKILDPQYTQWGDLSNVFVVWMDRDRNEQARSHVKLLRTLGQMEVSDSVVRSMSQGYGKDTSKALNRLSASGAHVMRMTFEFLLSNPYEGAESIARHIHADLDIEKMAATVIRRHPSCMPDMDIELSLVSQGAMNIATPQAK